MEPAFGFIDAPFYKNLAARARDAAEALQRLEALADKDRYVTTTLRPLLIDVVPLRDSVLYLLNSGLLEGHIRGRLKSGIDVPRDVTEFQINKRFRFEKDWGQRTKLRVDLTHPLTEKLYSQSLQAIEKFPLIFYTVQTMQDIVASHIGNIARHLFPDYTAWRIPSREEPLESVIRDIDEASGSAFVEELMPFMALSAAFHSAVKPEAPLPLEEVFTRGLVNAFHARSFTTRTISEDKDKGDKINQCPFSGHIGHLWNTHIIKGDDGVYTLAADKRMSAFPATIARLIQQNDPQNRLSPL